MSKLGRALFVAPDYATGKKSGGGQRTAHLFEALSRHYAVEVLVVGRGISARSREAFAQADAIHHAHARDPIDKGIWPAFRWVGENRLNKALRAFTSRSALYSTDAVMRRSIEHINFSDFDLIVGRYLLPLASVGAFENKQTPVLIDIDDRDDRVIETRIQSPQTHMFLRMIYHVHLHQLRSVMAKLLSQADHLWFSSEQDVGGVDTENTAMQSRSVLPNIPIHPNSDIENERAALPTVLFVGVSGHTPNFAGVCWFLKQCWPKIRMAVPNARMQIVGGGDWNAIPRHLSNQDGVEIIGSVKELASYYAGATLSVAPIHTGGGTKIKILESYAFGVPVAATNHAAFGFVRELVDLIYATDEPSAFAAMCIDLLSNPDTAELRGKAGRQIVRAEYSKEKFDHIVTRDAQAVCDVNQIDDPMASMSQSAYAGR